MVLTMSKELIGHRVDEPASKHFTIELSPQTSTYPFLLLLEIISAFRLMKDNVTLQMLPQLVITPLHHVTWRLCVECLYPYLSLHTKV